MGERARRRPAIDVDHRMNRREFLHSVGGAAVAGGMCSTALAAAGGLFARPDGPPARVAVLRELSFPTIGAAPIGDAALRTALADVDAAFLDADALAAQLSRDRFDVLLMSYGSAFPKALWPAFIRFLRKAGHWVNLGGVPCAVPVVRTLAGWRREERTVTYHRALGITQAFAVDVPEGAEWLASPAHPWAESLKGQITPRRVHECYVCFTREKRVRDEDGSDGVREAVLEPLLTAVRVERRADGTTDRWPVAAPVVMVDRLDGEFAGGRWLWCTGDGEIGAQAIRTLAAAAAGGWRRFSVRPSYACYAGGETVSVTAMLERPMGDAQEGADAVTVSLDVFDDRGRKVAGLKEPLPGGGAAARTDTFDLTRPGYYRVEAELAAGVAAPMRAATGFWIFDESALRRGTALTADATGLRRDGRPFPVTGTTYMASDVHRQFLAEPNPEVWERDFAAMQRAGVNVVRTGIWTGWSRLMTAGGVLHEPALRALDAFMLTAARHDIAVVFTFFAFLPPAWGGANPYLDPNAVRMQKHFVTAIAGRYRAMRAVMWDLINEPSFCSAEHLWTTRPNGDEFERREWAAWLDARYLAESSEARDLRLQEVWRGKPGEGAALPELEDFADANLAAGRRPLKALDYRLFAQDAFRRWVGELAAAIRTAAGPGQLVTVGQDEGGTGERPSNQFFGPSVDLTSIHTWWYNDDLLWDSIVSKHPARANLVQETGVMFYETADGRPWRTEGEVRNLFERKLALAIGAGGAGYINWIWNTNPYMPSDNEAAIGLLRPDGTIKPEFDVWRGITGFVRSVAPRLDGRAREQVVMVVPQANLFSVRTTAAEATKRAVRAMHYHLRVPMAAVGEFNIDAWPERPALAVVPSPRLLTREGWARLRAWAEQGSTVLVTGPFDEDEHGLPTGRMAELGLPDRVRPVMAAEFIPAPFGLIEARYRGEQLQRVECASLEGAAKPEPFRDVTVGRGRVLWTAAPVELAEGWEAVAALYRHALTAAGVAAPVRVTPDDASVLVYAAPYRDHTLYTVVAESSTPMPRVGVAPAGPAGAHFTVSVGAGRAVLVLVHRATGAVVADYPKGSVTQG